MVALWLLCTKYHNHNHRYMLLARYTCMQAFHQQLD